MKIEINHDRGKSLLSVSCIENCDSDSWPMVSPVEFRNYPSAPDPQIAAIGAAILFAPYCGLVVDFCGSRVGIEAARAIRTIVPGVDELYPIDAGRRDISQGVASLVVGEARQIFGRHYAPNGIGRSARVVTWSGDFVTADRRSSTDHIGGDVFTNAALISPGTAVSVALALFWGGKDIRDIHVPMPPDDEKSDFDRIAGGLEFVGIKLHRLGAGDAPLRRIAA